VKLLYFVETFGDRACIRVEWSRMVFFSGKQPERERLIAVESSDLRGSSVDKVLAFLERLVPGHDRATSVIELPERAWRPAVMDDMLDAENAAYIVWQLAKAMPLADFADFGERHAPELLERTRAALAAPDEAKKLTALSKLEDFGTRVLSAFGRLPERVQLEHLALRERLERERIRELEARSSDLDAWIALASELRHELVANLFVCQIARRIVAEAKSDADFSRRVEQVRDTPSLKARTARVPGFWAALAPRLRFSANVKGETVDVSAAVEQSVPASWELYGGRRIGGIAPGRTALVIAGKRPTYVRGERKLKFAIARAGGALKRFGCTLTIAKDTASSLHTALLDVERIEALANLDPESLRPELEALALPPSHDAWSALAAARRDPRHARMLADLLVEHRIGVDADVARALARAQSARNRR
jgi:hypothetical protein